MTTTNEEYGTPEQRVARGALLLDDQRPGWALIVDPGTIDILSASRCVVGQVYGDYVDGFLTLAPHMTLGGPLTEGFAYGFVAPFGTGTGRVEAAWTREILSRRVGLPLWQRVRLALRRLR